MQNNLKRIFFTIIATVLIFSTVAFAHTPFNDISGHWAQKYIEQLYDRGIVNGTPDGAFNPEDNITTAEFISMLLRDKYGYIEPTGNHWASGYMDYAYNSNMIDAQEKNVPDEPLLRRFAARIVHELLLNVYVEKDEDDISVAEQLLDLYDCPSCVMHVSQVYVKGIMGGYDDSRFHQTDYMTRAQAATIVMRVLDKSMRVVPDMAEKHTPTVETITLEDAAELVKSTGAIILDVRTAEKHASGCIEGSINISADIIMNDLSVFDYDKAVTVIVHCQSGANSAAVCTKLKDAGYTNVYNLGGVTDFDEANRIIHVL